MKKASNFDRAEALQKRTGQRSLRSGMSAVYSVIHFLCAIQLNGDWFNVLESGDPHYWLFVPLYSTTNAEGESIPTSTARGEPFPVLRSRLPKEVQTHLNSLLHEYRPQLDPTSAYSYPEGKTWFARYDQETNTLEWFDPFPFSPQDLRYYERLPALPPGTRILGKDGVRAVIIEYAGGGSLNYVCKTSIGLTRYSEHYMSEIEVSTESNNDDPDR